jgi:hypothetical protein
MMIMKVRVDLQYIPDCPNVAKLRDNVMQAVRGIEDKVDISETVVMDEGAAAQVMFRGSPTLLINGEDVLGMPVPVAPAPACRIYPNGLPVPALIRMKIDNVL